MVSAGNNGHTTGLRSDSRQWLNSDSDAVGALVRGLEAFAMHMIAGPMTRHRHMAVRHLGTYMQRIADHRIREMHANDGAQRIVADHLAKVFNWMIDGQNGVLSEEPTDALNELYATSFYADGRAARAGVGSDEGVHRIAVRGT